MAKKDETPIRGQQRFSDDKFNYRVVRPITGKGGNVWRVARSVKGDVGGDPTIMDMTGDKISRNDQKEPQNRSAPRSDQGQKDGIPGTLRQEDLSAASFMAASDALFPRWHDLSVSLCSPISMAKPDQSIRLFYNKTTKARAQQKNIPCHLNKKTVVWRQTHAGTKRDLLYAQIP